jgi:hypothetical protein
MKIIKLLLCFGLILLFCLPLKPCSLYKLTSGGKTYVGNNEDAWREDSQIWFETGKDGKLGAVYLGHDDKFPQGGMNEAGLCFDGFTVYDQPTAYALNKLPIENPAFFIKKIMQECTTVDEVKNLALQYDLNVFRNGLFFFVDKSGSYISLEVDSFIIGSDSSYIQANFCPSQIKGPSDIKMKRYWRGMDFLKQCSEVGWAKCTGTMMAMHECRPGLGDGTTYTNIFDLDAGDITLYFYHNYNESKKFNLQEELLKGNHSLSMPVIFAPNTEYNKFTHYYTPTNSWAIRIFILFAAFLLLLISIYFVIKRKLKELNAEQESYKGLKKLIYLLLILNFTLIVYLAVLMLKRYICYSAAPYYEPEKWGLNALAYLATAMAILVPIIIWFWKFKIPKSTLSGFRTFFIQTNLVMYIVLLVLFGYWGLILI